MVRFGWSTHQREARLKTDPRYLAEAFYDAFNRGDVEEALSHFAEDCEFHEPVNGAISIYQFRRNLINLKTAMPDSKMNLESFVIKGPTVALEGHFGGQHTGELVGPSVRFPATDNHLDLRFAAFITGRGDKIVAHRVYFNQLDVVTQLKLLP